MKTRILSNWCVAVAVVAAVGLFAGRSAAQDTSAAAAASTADPAPVRLSYGVSQIVDLTRAKVSDNVILSFVRHSGDGYGLDAAQIVYLRQQGVSDQVIKAMLNQRARLPSAPAPQSSASSTTAAATSTVVEPTTTYVQTVPASSVYVIPDTQTYRYYNWYYGGYPYYGYYPYSGAYLGWSYPAVSFSFGWHRGWGGYHGRGFYGRGFHQGFRGGGFHHGFRR